MSENVIWGYFCCVSRFHMHRYKAVHPGNNGLSIINIGNVLKVSPFGRRWIIEPENVALDLILQNASIFYFWTLIEIALRRHFTFAPGQFLSPYITSQPKWSSTDSWFWSQHLSAEGRKRTTPKSVNFEYQSFLFFTTL